MQEIKTSVRRVMSVFFFYRGLLQWFDGQTGTLRWRINCALLQSTTKTGRGVFFVCFLLAINSFSFSFSIFAFQVRPFASQSHFMTLSQLIWSWETGELSEAITRYAQFLKYKIWTTRTVTWTRFQEFPSRVSRGLISQAIWFWYLFLASTVTKVGR